MQGGNSRRSVNPMDAFRKQQKHKEQLKIKDAREKRRRDEEDAQELVATMEKEYAELNDIAASRSLSQAEKARRRELKDALADANNAVAPVRGKSGVLIVEDKPLPSGLFDPLSEQHRALHERAKKQRDKYLAEQAKRNEEEAAAAAAAAAKEAEAAANKPLEPDEEWLLDDDFLPALPMEIFPPWHKPKQGPMIIRITGGYPPPPLDPAPASAHVPLAEQAQYAAKPVAPKFAQETLALVPTSVVANKSKPAAAAPIVVVGPPEIKKTETKEEKDAAMVDDMYNQFLEEMGDLI